MKKKEKILRAIDVYDVYNKSVKAVLRALVVIATSDNVANISIRNLSTLSKVSRQGVYNALRPLERDMVVLRSKVSNSGATVFTLNLDQVNKILDYYDNLQNAHNVLK